MKPNHYLRPQAQQQLSPQLSQAIHLASLSSLELQACIEAEVNENPLLEYEEETLSVFPQSYRQNLARDSLDPFPEPCDTLNLHNHLLLQCDLLPLNAQQKEIAYTLIDALDSNGYLHEPLEKLFKSPTQIEQILSVLKHVQSLEPTGIGARNLQECLLIQLAALPLTQISACAKILITESLAQLHLPARELSERHGIDESHIIAALQLIKQLEPKPGRSFDTSSPALRLPDLGCTVKENHIQLYLIEYPWHAIRLHPSYSKQLKAAPHWQAYLNQAKQLLQALNLRHESLLKTAQVIIQLQKRFFYEGPIAIQALTLQDLAEQTGYHISTLSRITTQKYIDTPYGIFELKYFLNGEVKTQGGKLSSLAAKTQIRMWIEQEDPHNPLTDERLMELLSEKGITLARRTVAKYRESLKIPPYYYRQSQEPTMHIQISGHGLEVTPALKQAVEEKFQKLEKHASAYLTQAHVILKSHAGSHQAEATVHAKGTQLFAECEDTDMYRAIHDLVDKLDKQCVTLKEKLQNHSGKKEE